MVNGNVKFKLPFFVPAMQTANLSPSAAKVMRSGAYSCRMSSLLCDRRS